MTDYYQRIDYLNATTAKRLLVSPAQAFHELHNPKPPSPAMVLGTRVHLRVLEPARYAAELAVWDGPPRNTKEGKDAWAKWQEAHPGCAALSVEDHDRIEGMAASLRKELAYRLAVADCEWEHYWQRGGAKLKAKLDWLGSQAGDVKTFGGEWSESGIQRAAYDGGWFVSGSHYMDAAKDAGRPVREFLFAVVQSSAPFECAILPADDDFLAYGRERMDQAIEIWKACQASGVWPTAQAAGAIGNKLRLPRWAGRDVVAPDALAAWGI